MSSDAPRRACRRRRSSAALSATSPARSTPACDLAPDPASPRGGRTGPHSPLSLLSAIPDLSEALRLEERARGRAPQQPHRGSAGAALRVLASRRLTAGEWRIPSPSATASGAPDRLLCPDPVRYMSVIMEAVEHATAYGGGLYRWPERVTAMVCWLLSPRSARYKRTQHRGRWRRLVRRMRTRRGAVALLERAVCRPLAPARSFGRDKIPNQRADLAILRLVTGGRCWVRTNVG